MSNPSSGPQPQQPYGPPPSYGQPGYVPMPPPNNLAWGIAALLLCWPFAIPSLIKANEVNNFWMRGMTDSALASAAEAKKWGKIGVIVGAIGLVLFILLYVVLFVVLFSLGAAAGGGAATY